MEIRPYFSDRMANSEHKNGTIRKSKLLFFRALKSTTSGYITFMGPVNIADTKPPEFEYNRVEITFEKRESLLGLHLQNITLTMLIHDLEFWINRKFLPQSAYEYVQAAAGNHAIFGPNFFSKVFSGHQLTGLLH